MQVTDDSRFNEEMELRERAAAWPEHRALEGLTASALRTLTRREGIDFATALLYDRLRNSPAHRGFIERLESLRRGQDPRASGASVRSEMQIVIVPGALYRERPEMGGDGRLIREVAATFGWKTQLIPLDSFGSVETNAVLIRRWFEQEGRGRIVVVSLSKGGADFRCALERSRADEVFRSVVAWVNVCGPLRGSRMADWILESRLRTWLARWKCWWQRRDFRFITELRHEDTALEEGGFRLPESMKMVSLMGFPLRRHLTTAFSRFCHRTVGAHGPNDGTSLLSDLLDLPGDVYPAWGMDHYFRPEAEARGLVSAVFQYLIEANCIGL